MEQGAARLRGRRRQHAAGEPNWDQEFAKDPHAAHAKQKVFQIIYGNLAALAASSAASARRRRTEERDRRTQKYAVSGFEKFVMDHIKWMPDEPTLKKNIQSMRRTASAEGFNELEVATVYDPRMLGILWKASKYDRMTAAAPRAVVTGKGRTLAPGAATPFNGNARRHGFDDAQRQLAKSGKVSDAAEVFRSTDLTGGPAWPTAQPKSPRRSPPIRRLGTGKIYPTPSTTSTPSTRR